MLWVLSKEYFERNITFFRCFVHIIDLISLLRITMFCETLPTGPLRISPWKANSSRLRFLKITFAYICTTVYLQRGFVKIMKPTTGNLSKYLISGRYSDCWGSATSFCHHLQLKNYNSNVIRGAPDIDSAGEADPKTGSPVRPDTGNPAGLPTQS
jgi:hypothetical protein